MRKEDKSKLIEVYKSTPWEAELVKGLLNANDIQALPEDSVLPNVILPATAMDVAVLVNEKDYEAAMKIIREREKNTEEVS